MIEMAFYSTLHRSPRIEFVNVVQQNAAVSLFFMLILCRVLYSITFHTFGLRAFDNSWWIFVQNVLMFFVFTFVRVLMFHYGRRMFRALYDLNQVKKDFDVRECSLSDEADRQLLLGAIRTMLQEFEIFLECGII